MKGLCSSVFGGIYLYFGSNWLQAAENWHEFETALSIHIYLIFLTYCILQRAMFIASANTVMVCKSESPPPSRNHMARILSPDTSHVHTQEYTCYARLIIIQASLVLQSRTAQKMRVRFTACQLLHWNHPCLCYPSGNLPLVQHSESIYVNSCHAVNLDPHLPNFFHIAVPSDLGSVKKRFI